jgi:AraC-like DNA-binding protein
MNPPWSLRVQDEAPLTIMAVVKGEAWIVYDRRQPESVHAGDVAILRGPEPYTVADSPATAPQIVIQPGQICETPGGESVYESMDLGVRTWGNDPNGSVVLLTGTYQADGEISKRLVNVLPTLIVMRADEWDCPVLALLADEVGRDELGQAVVLDRLLDLLVISALRAWFARPEAQSPSWYNAQTDPVVGRALRLLHNNPAHPWTVASLAADVGVSRAALARRFNDLVGEPPMAFLTGWRLALAADLLLDPDATVGAVARHVGYGSPFTFSAAFKRAYGVSPQGHRNNESGNQPRSADTA